MARRLSLQDDIKQTKAFRNLSEESTLSIVRTYTLIRRGVAAVVESEGLTPAQYNVLRILRGAGAPGLPTLTVRDRMIDEAAGITRLIDKLERGGLVKRDRSAPDRRQVYCRITAKGLAMLKRLDVRIAEADETGGAGLTPRERKQLLVLLEKVRGALTDAAPDARR
ncbi:MAG: winged helix DNA-binding protein [Gemmatimonadetes bacterium]|nr:winged helix DNA-binding protein [Gemmatimonadota bacterium]MBI3568235.1 winged helix DNA-binding protein [Gemmatimonadota bacterium]